MRAPMKLQALVLAAVLAAAIAVAGCGGGSSGGGGGEPASLAPKAAPVYLEASLKPDGKEGEEINELVNSVVGIENIGEYITEEIEKSALGEGEKFNFEEEVEPWLGERAGMYLTNYDGDEFDGFGIAIETTNAGEAEEFVEKRVEEGDEKSEEGEFEGVKYYVSSDDESAVGVIGDYLAVGQTKSEFEEMVKTSEGEGLSESSKFTKATEAAGEPGFGHVYVDIGALIEEAKSQIPPETEAFLDLTGIEPRNATAVIGVVPHAEEIELDVSSDLTKSTAPSGDASALLESLPATAVVGFASSEFGKSFGESLDRLDEQGIPGQVEPGQLKPALESMGINLQSVAESLGDIGGFVEGASESSVGGAIVIETKNGNEARNTVSNLGLLLRSARTPGVTALSGNLTGFSVRSAELGEKPLVVAAAGEKIVVAYGPRAATRALRGQAKTLGSTADFEAAKSALGATPIGLFVDGGPALKLVRATISPEERAQFAQAEPYVQKIAYVAAGEEAKGSTTTAKVIIGVQK